MHRNLSPTSSVDLNLSGGGSRGFGEFKESKSTHLSSTTVVETTSYGEINVVIEDDEDITTIPATQDVKVHPLAQLFKAAVAAGTFIVSTSAANLQHFKSKHTRLPTSASPPKPLSSDPTIAVSPSPTKSQQSSYGSSSSPSKPFHHPISTLVTSLKRSSHAVASTVAAKTTNFRKSDKEEVESEPSPSSVHDTTTVIPSEQSSSVFRPFHKTGHSTVPSATATATAVQRNNWGIGASTKSTNSPPPTPPKPSNAQVLLPSEMLFPQESPSSEPFSSFQEPPPHLLSSSQGSSPHSTMNPLWQTALQHANNDKANAVAATNMALPRKASTHSYLDESSSPSSYLTNTHQCESFEQRVHDLFNDASATTNANPTYTSTNDPTTATTTIPPATLPTSTLPWSTLPTPTISPATRLSNDSDDPFGPPTITTPTRGSRRF